jgi:membrane-associated phospholipid phosphatase
VVGVLVVLPLALLMVRQMRRGAWSTVDASQPRERPILFVVGAAGLLALLLYFGRAARGSSFVTGTAGVLAMIGLCAAVTPWLKVSLHMATASLAATVLLWQGMPLGWILGATLPLLAWSRVALGRHRWGEVAAGFVIGAVTGSVLAYLPLAGS